MTRVNLLEALRKTTEAAVEGMKLPAPSEWHQVFSCRLPDENAKLESAPYILHQIITGKDVQKPGQRPFSVSVARSLFCVWNADGQEAGLTLLNLMETVRLALIRPPAIGGAFTLDRGAGVETLIYPGDETAPFALGELISTWYVFGTEVQI